MKWIAFVAVLLRGVWGFAASPVPMGETTHIATAPNNPWVAAAVINNRIWFTLDGGDHWLITTALSSDSGEVSTAPQLPSDDSVFPKETWPEGGENEWDAADCLEDDSCNTDAPELTDEEDTFVVRRGGDENVAEIGDSGERYRSLVLAVSDKGDVVFWQRSKGLLTCCFSAAGCQRMGSYANIRALAFDAEGHLWLVAPQSIYLYDNWKLMKVFHSPAIRSVGSAKGVSGLRVWTSRGLCRLNAAGDIRECRTIRLSQYETVEWAAEGIFAARQGRLFWMHNDGSAVLLAAVNESVQQIVAANNAVWLRSPGGWFCGAWEKGGVGGPSIYGMRHRQAVQDVAVDGEGKVWLATTSGPVVGSSGCGETEPRIPSNSHEWTEFLWEKDHVPFRVVNGAAAGLVPKLQLRVRLRSRDTVVHQTDAMEDRRRDAGLYVGIWLQWQIRPLANALLLHAEKAAAWRQRNQLKRARRVAMYVDKASNEWTTSGAAGRVVRQLEIQKWKLWLELAGR